MWAPCLTLFPFELMCLLSPSIGISNFSFFALSLPFSNIYFFTYSSNFHSNSTQYLTFILFVSNAGFEIHNIHSVQLVFGLLHPQ